MSKKRLAEKRVRRCGQTHSLILGSLQRLVLELP